MKTFVPARRPSIRGIQDLMIVKRIDPPAVVKRADVKVYRQTPPEIIRVNQATWIPSGMHGTLPTYATVIPAGMHSDFRTVRGNTPIERDLIARGVRPERARALVSRATARINRRRAGLGDDGTDAADQAAAAELLAAVQAKGGDYQRAHAALIAKIPTAMTDQDKLWIRNAIEGLYSDWTAFAVDAKNGTAPFEWNRLNPVDAILIAVRDDIRNTADLLAANKAQQVLAKQIAALPKLGKGGPLLNIDVPWYVWAAGAAAGAAVAGKALHIW